MEIRIPCSHCGKVLLVQSESAGKVGVCPACHHKIQIVRRTPDHTPSQIADTLPSEPQATHGSTSSAKSNPPSSREMNQPSGSGSNSDSLKRKPSSSQNLDDVEVSSASSKSSFASHPTSASRNSSSVDPLSERPDADWYVRPPNGNQYGPASNEVMKSWIAEGRIGSQSIVWRTGWTDWLPASRVFNNLTDMPSEPASARAPKVSKAAEYIAIRGKRIRFRPIHYVAIGLGLLLLISICIMIFS